MQNNWKSFGLGFISAGLLGVLIAANSEISRPEAGRFVITISGDNAIMLDSTTGKAWQYKSNNVFNGVAAPEFFGSKIVEAKKQ